jgi:ankyrin repeat protein
MVAASYGSLGSVKQLVTLGASVSLQDERGYSAFHFAAEKVKQQSSIK